MPDEFVPPPPAYTAPSYPPPYGATRLPPPPRRSAWFYVGVIGGSFAAIMLVLSLLGWAASRAGSGGKLFRSEEVGVIDVTGVILTAEKINSQLREFADDDHIKAIILHIDSPGGAASPSQEIYHEVLRLRQDKHKKIVASIDSVGASGAYYIASACDRIYANQASVVGSIGVVMEWVNYGDLLRWAKLKSVDVHAGDLKTAGDPSRDPTPKEQAYFQSLVDVMYGQFIHDVAVGRHMPEEKLRPLATGQVWTGQQALPLGLIDREGGMRVALMETAKDAGISGEPVVVHPEKKQPSLLATLAAGSNDLFNNPGKVLGQAPGFYFLWK